jgi:hypothetical protein
VRELFRRASLVAEQKFERALFHPPFQEDGTYTPYGNITPQPFSFASFVASAHG